MNQGSSGTRAVIRAIIAVGLVFMANGVPPSEMTEYQQVLMLAAIAFGLSALLWSGERTE